MMDKKQMLVEMLVTLVNAIPAAWIDSLIKAVLRWMKEVGDGQPMDPVLEALAKKIEESL